VASQGEARGPLTWLGAILVVYLGVPLVAFAVRFASAGSRGFGEPGLYPALWVSLECATISLALITVFGLPLAYYLAHARSRTSAVVYALVQVPLALPPVMAGIVLIYLVGPYTFLGRLSGQRLTESMAGIVIAMTFCAAPFLVVSARAGFLAVDRGLLDTAAALGHSPASRFLRVSVPLAHQGIRAGMALSWLRAFGEYGAVVILAYNPSSLPVYTYNQFSGVGLPTTLAPTALALLVALAAVLASRLHRPRAARARALPAPLAPQRRDAEPVTFDVRLRLGTFALALARRGGAPRLAILGASGSGKSALLRCLAGLEGPGVGDVRYGAERVTDTAVEARHVGYVAQGFSLLPHLTVWEQLCFGRGSSPPLAAYWLTRLRLDGLEARYPHELSGGQRQRVGLAQVLARSPRVLLLDEPFSALDVPVRRELRRELRRLQHETDLATVLVTHDPEEAALLSDVVIVIDGGESLQAGPTREVFSRPASAPVARLLGIPNLFAGTVVAPGVLESDGCRVRTDDVGLVVGTQVQWSIRPELVGLVPGDGDPGDGATAALAGTILDVAHLGATAEVVVALSGDLWVEARAPEPLDLTAGERCVVELAPEAITVWPAERA